MTFEIPDEKIPVIQKWIDEVHKKNAEAQRKETPYYGASGGAFTYSFTPTSLGLVIKVTATVFKRDENNKVYLSEEKLDVTDYEDW